MNYARGPQDRTSPTWCSVALSPILWLKQVDFFFLFFFFFFFFLGRSGDGHPVPTLYSTTMTVDHDYLFTMFKMFLLSLLWDATSAHLQVWCPLPCISTVAISPCNVSDLHFFGIPAPPLQWTHLDPLAWFFISSSRKQRCREVQKIGHGSCLMPVFFYVPFHLSVRVSVFSQQRALLESSHPITAAIETRGMQYQRQKGPHTVFPPIFFGFLLSFFFFSTPMTLNMVPVYSSPIRFPPLAPFIPFFKSGTLYGSSSPLLP